MKYEVMTWPIEGGDGATYHTYTAVCNGELLRLPERCYRMYKSEKVALRNGIKFIQKHSNRKNKLSK